MHVLIRADSLATRTEIRVPHPIHPRHDPRVVRSLPITRETGRMSASPVEADTGVRANVAAFVAADTCARAGRFEAVRIAAWTRVIGG